VATGEKIAAREFALDFVRRISAVNKMVRRKFAAYNEHEHSIKQINKAVRVD